MFFMLQSAALVFARRMEAKSILVTLREHRLGLMNFKRVLQFSVALSDQRHMRLLQTPSDLIQWKIVASQFSSACHLG